MTIGNLCVWLSNLLLSIGPWLVGFLFCYNSIGNVCHMTNIKTTFLQSIQKWRKPNIFINNFFSFGCYQIGSAKHKLPNLNFKMRFFPPFQWCLSKNASANQSSCVADPLFKSANQMNEPKKGTTSSSDAKMLSKTLFDLVFLPRCSQTLLLLFDSKRIYDAFAMMHYTAAVTTNNHLHQMRFFFFHIAQT